MMDAGPGNIPKAREEILERWVREYGTSILRMCFVTLCDAREAEDAMQETFLKAWRAMEHPAGFQGRNGASEKTWLAHIALNVCRDVQRSRWFRHVDMGKALDELPIAAQEHDRSLLLDVMRLPEKYKQPVLLYYYHDMTIEETAEALGVGKSTVHNRLRKAEKLLKLALTGGDCYVQ